MIQKIFGSLLCLFFIFHFALTIIYNAPSNPIQAKYNKQISKYMDPLFTQNWRLFAPTPVTTNHYYYAKAKLADPKGEIRTTEWIDISKYMYEVNHANRFTPYNLLLRIPRGAFGLMGEKDEVIHKIAKKVQEGKLDEDKYDHIINRNTEHNKEMALSILNRFAEAQLASRFKSEEILELKVLLVESKPIPFSKNGDIDYEKEESYLEFDWTKPQKVITLY